MRALVHGEKALMLTSEICHKIIPGNTPVDQLGGNMQIYIVGGAVRDSILHRSIADKDYVVLNADEATLMAAMPHLKRITGGADGVFIDRDDQYTISPAADIEQDLELRDLTINALARERAEPRRLIAHPLALPDLENRILRPVHVANFGADPCRAIRAARFAAVLPGFTAGPGLYAAMRHAISQGLGKVAGERIGQEVRKACAGGAPGRFLAFLGRAGCLSPWFAPFSGRCHLRMAAENLMQRMAGQPAMWVWMAMCHHLAAPKAYSMGERLRLPRAWILAGVDAAALLPPLRYYSSLPAVEKIPLLMHLHQKKLLAACCHLARARYGETLAGLEQRLRRDLRAILAVNLPQNQRNQGRTSGQALLRLRTAALDQMH